MQHILFLLAILLVGQVAAQESDNFIVTSVSGKVSYIEEKSSKEQSLLPGQELSAKKSDCTQQSWARLTTNPCKSR